MEWERQRERDGAELEPNFRPDLSSVLHAIKALRLSKMKEERRAT
jgi:hypothetical protein